jgi:hypothetical protein
VLILLSPSIFPIKWTFWKGNLANQAWPPSNFFSPSLFGQEKKLTSFDPPKTVMQLSLVVSLVAPRDGKKVANVGSSFSIGVARFGGITISCRVLLSCY